MKIIVQHEKINRQTGDKSYTDVAEVNAIEIAPFANTMECLEYAYRWTNNVMGSWSIKEQYLPTRKSEPALNGDYNSDVTVLHTRPDGMGQRSTMMGDRMVVGGDTYEVAMAGFEKVK